MTLGLGLLPIVPILLLPFIIIIFVIVFPLWVVALAVVGLILVLIRALDWLAHRIGLKALHPAAIAVNTAFRWVLTFGGLAQRGREALTAESAPRP